ncbi:MAG TPA: bacterial transcriptional activator domain-containing protein, partial [Anaerolineae bacterium]|nr:bacterial transcriptional activator domain-containing protein [Anaerolineae bacterium]
MEPADPGAAAVATAERAPALERLLRAAGEYEPALGYARRWVEVDALQEEAQRQLMRLLALTGQRSAALVQFESCRQLLAEELGVAPNPETVALHQQIQSGKLLSPAESRPPPAAPQPAGPNHPLCRADGRARGAARPAPEPEGPLADPD